MSSGSTAIGSASSDRRRKLATITKSFLEATTLSPTDEWSLAAKAMFFMSSCIGRLGQAAVKHAHGFGVFMFPVHGQPLFFHGVVPAEVLAEFASRGAFFFFLLEALAQILALLVFRNELRGPFLAFVDTTAAEHALTKG